MEEEKLRFRFNELDDMAVTTVSAFLGLTLGCALPRPQVSTRSRPEITTEFNALFTTTTAMKPFSSHEPKRLAITTELHDGNAAQSGRGRWPKRQDRSCQTIRAAKAPDGPRDHRQAGDARADVVARSWGLLCEDGAFADRISDGAHRVEIARGLLEAPRREINPKGFLAWMAGTGIKGGVSHGRNRRDRLPSRVQPGHGA